MRKLLEDNGYKEMYFDVAERTKIWEENRRRSKVFLKFPELE
jgi:hypothetical protein